MEDEADAEEPSVGTATLQARPTLSRRLTATARTASLTAAASDWDVLALVLDTGVFFAWYRWGSWQRLLPSAGGVASGRFVSAPCGGRLVVSLGGVPAAGALHAAPPTVAQPTTGAGQHGASLADSATSSDQFWSSGGVARPGPGVCRFCSLVVLTN